MLSYYFWVFMLGAMLGVIVEMLWCMLRYKKIESRKGVIYGPFNPLYGGAALCISYCINHVTNKSMGNIFIIGVVVASFIEYLCSYWQEKVTGTISWNYESFKFNLHGRINFIYSIFWGFLTIFWFNICMPVVGEFASFISEYEFVTIFCIIGIVIDCLISLIACIRRKERRQKVEARNKFERRIDVVYNDERMQRIYPNSEFVD